MTAHRHRALIQRLDNGPGVGERFYVQPASRKGRWKWFGPQEVPSFEGASAWFEIDRVGGRWVVLGPAR